MFESVFANLKKPKYKPVDIRAFEDAISQSISHDYNSSQIRITMDQRDEFPGAGRGTGRGRGQYSQIHRAVSGGIFQKSANFNNLNRNHGQYNQGSQNDDSYMQDIETFGQYNQTYGNDGLYAQSTENFDKGRARNINFGRSFNNEPRNATQPSEGFSQTQSKSQVQNRSQVETKVQAQSVTAAAKEARLDATTKSEIYAQMKKNRVVEREQAIKDGLIPDPNTPCRLEGAIDFHGTCETKCPEFEMIEREIQNNIDRLEMDENEKLDRNKAVKAYRRSADGNDQPLPADVRSPKALMSTLDYLIERIMSYYPLKMCYEFIRDRTRSIRQDFTLQNIRDVSAVKVYERIARFHIVCLHELCGMDKGKFNKQQETEQLSKVLLSLMEFYEGLRKEGIETPNEAEFRAYYIIIHIRNKDIVRQVSSQPVRISKHPYVKQALKFHAMAQRNNEIEGTSSRHNKAESAFGSQNNYVSFFNLVADPHTPFLMACLLETHFPEVRKDALNALNAAYMTKATGVEAEYIRKVLCYDSLSQCLKEAKYHGIRMDRSLKEPTLLFGLKHYESRADIFLEPLSDLAQKKSISLVEVKKDGKTLSEIVNGYKLNDEQSAPTINEAIYAQHRVPTNESEVQHEPAAKALDLQCKRDLVMKRAQEAEALAAEERKKVQELMDQRSITPRKDMPQVANEYATYVQQRVPEQYFSGWFVLEPKPKSLKRALFEDKCVIKEQRMLKTKRRLEQQKVKEESSAQTVKGSDKTKPKVDKLRRRLNKRRQRLEAKQKLVEKREQMLEEEIRQLQGQNERGVGLLCVGLPRPGYCVDRKTKAKKQLGLENSLKKKAGAWLKRVRDRITKKNTKHRIIKNKKELCWILRKNNPYRKFDLPKSNTPKFNSAEIDKRIQQSLAADHVVMENERIVEYNKNSIWDAEDFGLGISKRVLHQMHDFNAKHPNINIPQRINWQLVISTEDTQLQSSLWFKYKFNLDDESLRNVDHYATHDITSRMIVANAYPITRPIAEGIGGIVFAIPEQSCTETVEERQEKL